MKHSILSETYDTLYTLSITLYTLSSPPSNTTRTPSRSLHMCLLLTTAQPTPQCTEIDCCLSVCTMALWVICGTTLAHALTLLDCESSKPTFDKILSSCRLSTLDILRGLPEGSRLSLCLTYLLLISSTNSKLNSLTSLFILPLAHNIRGQLRSGLVGYFKLLILRSCPPARANCKPCYMSASNGACEFVCKSTHITQK